MVIKNAFIRLLVIILAIGGMIAFVAYSQSHPPEKAKITGVRIGYFSAAEGWIYATSFPVQIRQLQVCGMMVRAKSAPLLFTITDPEDKNKYLHQKNYYFEFEPGDFCVNLQLVEDVSPGKYILWIMDGTRSVAQLAIEFKEK